MRFLCLFLAFATVSSFAQKRIALTFDDAPRPSTTHFTGAERGKKLLQALKEAEVTAAFFCNSPRGDQEAMSRLVAYAAAGHRIANHTREHPDFHKISLEKFTESFLEADKVLQPLAQFRRWFRFPYLHEGETLEKRDAFRKILVQRGYRNGYVTVDTWDWSLDSAFQKALRAGKTIDWEKLGNFYAGFLIEEILFYDALAESTLHSSPAHVLLLHENDLAALYVPLLVKRLHDLGWAIVSPDEAYADRIASLPTKTLRAGEGHVAALAIDAGFPGNVNGPWHDEEKIAREAEARGAWH